MRMTSLFSYKLVNITKFGLDWKHFWVNEKPFIYRSYKKVYGLPSGQGLGRQNNMTLVTAGGPGSGPRTVHKPSYCLTETCAVRKKKKKIAISSVCYVRPPASRTWWDAERR